MTQQQFSMKLDFEDNTTINIGLTDSVLKSSLIGAYKHLQYITIPFKTQDWTKSDRDNTINFLVDKLAREADKLQIPIDVDKCLLGDQLYFNQLHSIYEKNYDGNSEWLEFHELIHSCESNLSSTKIQNIIRIDYRETAGLLQRKISRDWLTESVTAVRAGQVYCTWMELGKTPYQYWKTGEPNDIDRINELAKPWINFRPALYIALEDTDFFDKNIIKLDRFTSWWSEYRDKWCQHWNLTQWSVEEMFSVIPVGNVDNLDLLIDAVQRKVSPKSIRLNDQDNESLKVDLVIDAVWKSHPPGIKIKIDNTQIEKEIDLVHGVNHVSFDVELDHQSHHLTIERYGATSLDPTQLVIIQKLSIDDIDCNNLILTNSWFTPIYPEPWATEQKNQGQSLLDTIPFETVMGYNGTWRLDFECPIYPYLLKANSS